MIEESNNYWQTDEIYPYNIKFDWSDKDFTTVPFHIEKRKRLEILWDWKFFAILPALNINIHSKSFEFEWLFLGVYLNFWKN